MERDGWRRFKAAFFVHAALGVILLLAFGLGRAFEQTEYRNDRHVLSPDATLLERERQELQLIDLKSGAVRWSKEGLCHGTTFSADSKEMLFLRSTAPNYVSRLHIVDIAACSEMRGPAADRAVRMPGRAEVLLVGDGNFSQTPPAAVRIWDSSRDEEILRFTPFSAGPGAGWRWEGLAVSPDGRRVALGIDHSGRHESRIALWDLENARPIMEETFDAALTGLLFSPDGSSLVATIGAYQRGEWIRFDSAEGARRGSASMGQLSFEVAFSPDSRRLVLCPSNIQIWDLEDSRMIRELPVDGFRIKSLVHPENRIVAADDMATVRSWDLSEAEPDPEVWRLPQPSDVRRPVWIALGLAWLAAFWPFVRKASRLRAAGTPYHPSFGGRLLAVAAVGAIAGPASLFVDAGPGMSWEAQGMMAGAQVVGAAAAFLSFLAFLALRVPFRKRMLLPLSGVLGAGGLAQLYLLAAISASC